MPKQRAFIVITVVLLTTLVMPVQAGQPVSAQSPDRVSTPDATTCEGTLVVTALVWNSLANPVYRVSGSGPGLPVQAAVPSSTWTTLTFSLPGPGSWSGLSLYYSDGGAGPWTLSDFMLAVTCEAPIAGCDMLVPIPKTAVGGRFVADALVYYEPGKLAQPQVVIKAGNTARVTRMDATGDYYEIIWQCQFLWVRANTLSPNPDKVWNSTPLPTWPANYTGPEQPAGGTAPVATAGLFTGTAAGYPVYTAPKNASTYTVQAGDNLFRIAIHFGVNLYTLARVNGIVDIQRIYVGQVLNIDAAR